MKTVLIVDDDPDARAIVRRILEKEHIQVFEAEGVSEAIQQAEAVPPQLVLLDLNMPEEDGISFLKRRGSIPVLAPVPFMVITSLSDSDSVYQAVGLGAVDYLTKPFRAHVLLSKIKRAFKERTFGVYEFKSSSAVTAKIKIPAEVRLLCEAGMTIQSPVKIAPDSKVQIQNPFLKKPGLENCIFQTSPKPPLYTGTVREYLIQVSFIGITESVRQTILKFMSGEKS